MSQQMPQKLQVSPLRETIFEIRFQPTTPAAGDLLPGLLYSAMKSDYPEVMPLPMASVPRGIREKNPDLHFQPSHRLQGNVTSVQVGDRAVSLITTEYPGWNRFREKLESLIKAVRETGLVKHVDRFSLKYINIIEASGTEKQLALINMKIELNNAAPSERGFQLRAEYDEGKCITIIQITPGSTAKHPSSGKEVSGLLFEVDTIRFEPDSAFLTNPAAFLEEGHSVAKRTFFSLLAKTTLERLQPLW